MAKFIRKSGGAKGGLEGSSRIATQLREITLAKLVQVRKQVNQFFRIVGYVKTPPGTTSSPCPVPPGATPAQLAALHHDADLVLAHEPRLTEMLQHPPFTQAGAQALASGLQSFSQSAHQFHDAHVTHPNTILCTPVRRRLTARILEIDQRLSTLGIETSIKKVNVTR